MNVKIQRPHPLQKGHKEDLTAQRLLRLSLVSVKNTEKKLFNAIYKSKDKKVTMNSQHCLNVKVKPRLATRLPFMKM